MSIVTLGIDVAKNVFALHGVNEAGKAELVRPSVSRAKLSEVVASLPPCLIGMEAPYWQVGSADRMAVSEQRASGRQRAPGV